MVRKVVGPQKVVHQTEFPGNQQTGQILLEGGEALPLEVFTGQQLELWPHPHMVLPVCLIHGIEQERDPADARLNGAEAQAWMPLRHTGGTEVGNRLGGGQQ